MSRKPIQGDFGYIQTQRRRQQVVGIFDLVGFTDLESNDELLSAVRAMETQIGLEIEREDYAWDDRERGGSALEKQENEILIRSTGDGYFIAFSRADKELEVLNCLVNIHKRIMKKVDKVKLGVNKGANFVTVDLCGRVNIIGWGINSAARALGFAQAGQIICTGFIAEPLIQEHGDIFTEDVMIDIGVQEVKNTKLHLYNYYKEGEFGAPLAIKQK